MRVTSLKTFIAALQQFLTANPKEKSYVVVASKIDDNNYKLVTAKPQVSKAYIYKEDLEKDSISTLFNEEDLKIVPSLVPITIEVTLVELP